MTYLFHQLDLTFRTTSPPNYLSQYNYEFTASEVTIDVTTLCSTQINFKYIL